MNSETPASGNRQPLAAQLHIPIPPAPDLWAAAGLAAFAACFFLRALLGGKMLFMRDITVVWYPVVSSFIRSVAAGSWPMWDPYRGFGKPLLADPSAMIAYPFTWLNLFLPLHVYYLWFVLAHLAGSAWGTYALARRWGMSRPGAFTAGAIWVGSGPLLSLADLWHHFAGAAWIPWVFLAAERALARRTVGRALAWGAVLGAQLLAGSADMALLTILALASYVLALHVEWRRPWAPANRILVRSGLLALGFAVALSAVQWLPTLALARDSARLNLPRADREVWSLHPLGLFEVFFPLSWRQLPPVVSNTNAYMDLQAGLLYSVYLGLPAAALALAALGSSVPRRRWLLFTALAAVAVALGRYAGAYRLMVLLIPPLRAIRYPAKVMIVVAFCWSLLAGLGLDAWLRAEPPQRKRWARVVVAPILALAVLALTGTLFAFYGADAWGTLVVHPLPGSPPLRDVFAPTGARLSIASCVGLAVLALALGRLSKPAWARGLGVGVAVLVIGDLLLVHWNLHRVAPTWLLRDRPPVLASLDGSPPVRVYVYDYANRTRAARLGPGSPRGYLLAQVPQGWANSWAWFTGMHMHLYPPTSALWGIYGSYDMDLLGLYPTPLKELTEFLRDTAETTPLHLRLLQMGAVNDVIAMYPDPWWKDLDTVATIPGPFERPFQVLRVPEPLPRAYVVGGTRVGDGQLAFDALADPGFDPRREVILPVGNTTPAPPIFSGDARIVALKPDRATIMVQASSQGWLVMVDSYDPGWKATVDGTPAEVVRANVAFRAVPVGAGTHTIELTYRPAPVVSGLAASVLAALVGLAWLARPLLAGTFLVTPRVPQRP